MARPKKTKPPEHEDDETLELPKPSDLLVGWEGWPVIAEAAVMLGVSERTLLRRVLKGEVPRVLCPDKVWRYRPTDLEDLIVNEDEPTANPEPVQRAVLAQVVEMQNRGLNQAYRHIEQLMGLMVGPQQLFLKHLSSHAQRTSAQNETLQDKLLEGIELRESMLSEQNEREIERNIATAQENRKDQAIDFFKTTLGPALIQGLAQNEGNKKVNQLQEFAQSLDATTLEFLFSPENPLLSDEQRQKLASILDRPLPPPSAGETTQSANTDGSPEPSTKESS